MNLFKSHVDKLKLFLARVNPKPISGDKIIAVIGEHGKTTTVEALEATLARKFKTLSTSSNSRFKNPQTYNLAEISSVILKGSKSEQIILEIPSSIDPESKEFTSLITPFTVVITSSKGVKDSRFEAQRFIQFSQKVLSRVPEGGMAIINWEDQNLRTIGEQTKAALIYYGFDPKQCHIWAGNIITNSFETSFELNYGVERVEVHSKLLGKLNLSSLLAASAVAISQGIPLTSIKKGLESIEPLEGRMQVFEGHGGALILDDTYSSDPSSWEDSLAVLNQLSARRRIIVVGGMTGIEEESEKQHRLLAQKIYRDRMDIVLGGGGVAEFVADELRKLGFIEDRLEFGLSNPAIVARLLKILGRGDLALIKSNPSSRFDEIVKKIQLKK